MLEGFIKVDKSINYAGQIQCQVELDFNKPVSSFNVCVGMFGCKIVFGRVLDLESENDDCLTSVSRCPVNPLCVLGTATSNTISLPTVKMVTYERFWQVKL